MLRKLRRKFILTNMLLVSLVLVTVFAVLVISHYRKLSFQSDGALRSALSWQYDRPPQRLEITPPELEKPHKGDGQRGFFLPVFVATLDESGTVISYNDGGNVTISEETLSNIVDTVRDGPAEGNVSGMELRYLRETSYDGTSRIAFVDKTWMQESLQTLIITSLLVGAAALACFYLVSLFLSRLALKPVEEAWEQQRRFVADASHELKTPLTVILTNTGILLSHRNDTVEQQVKWVNYIQEEAQRMRGLVEDLLFLAKNDGAREPVGPTSPVDFSELCWSALLPFESVAFESGVTLDSDIVPNLEVTGRGDQLRRLVTILIDNGVKYAGQGGTVSLSLQRGEKNSIRLDVCNTGTLISESHMSHIFERFYRADDSRARASGGYGLGLAIAKSIAMGHGGSICAFSTETTVFTVHLPAALPSGPVQLDKSQQMG